MNTGVKFDNRRRLTKPKANSQQKDDKTRNPTPLALPPPEIPATVDSPHGSFHSKMLA